MVAHRGLSGLERENTCAAFIAAGNRDYFGIETDVRKAGDSSLVLLHDGSTKRVSSTLIKMSEHNLEEIRAVELNEFNDQPAAHLRIPTLEEYIRICRYYDKVAVLELKSEFSYDELDKIYEIIDGLGYISGTIFIGFDINNLLRLRERHPDVTAQYLVEHFDNELVEFLVKNKLDMDIYFSLITKEGVDLCHKNGITVNVWTVDEPMDAEKLIEMGVDMITSDILE